MNKFTIVSAFAAIVLLSGLIVVTFMTRTISVSNASEENIFSEQVENNKNAKPSTNAIQRVVIEPDDVTEQKVVIEEN